MAKNIRWQIPFVSIQGVHYRVDIYDEGTFTPVQLTAGPTPFVTDEDASDDFFCPVRSQSGTLQVCTLKPDGNYITLDELLPASNIARPVRLVSIAANNAETIEWQGFLSCEAYSQEYTGIPQILDLPLISVLEAMDSVEIPLNINMAFNRIISHIADAMKAIETSCGMSDLWNCLYISEYCRSSIISTYFYNNVYFNTKEIVDEDNIVVEVHSLSCKKILEQIAAFFGCCWRESKTDLYLEHIGSNNLLKYAKFSRVYSFYIDGTGTLQWSNQFPFVTNISSLKWMGTDHQKSVTQGAKRVTVTAKLKDFECKMSLRGTPLDNLVVSPENRWNTWRKVQCNTNENFYSQAQHKHWLHRVNVTQDSSLPSGKLAKITRGSTVPNIGYGSTWYWDDDQYLQHYDNLFTTSGGQVGSVDHLCTSFMGYMMVREEAGEHESSIKSGLVICGLPSAYRISSNLYLGISWFSLNVDDYIFKQRSPLIFAASDGKLQLDIKFETFTTQYRTIDTWLDKNSGDSRGFEMAIQWGNKWVGLELDPSEPLTPTFRGVLVDNFTTFLASDYRGSVHNGEFNLTIPINSYNAGFVTIYIFPKISGNLQQYEGEEISTAHNIFITQLDLAYVEPERDQLYDKSENVFSKSIGNAFRDEININVEIATNAHNKKLATIIRDSNQNTLKLINLNGNEVRPEKDLLNRLYSYYQSSRQTIELSVAHPKLLGLYVEIPNIRLRDIDFETNQKYYLPLSETRDWQTDVCKLTCFEIPEEPSES